MKVNFINGPEVAVDQWARLDERRRQRGSNRAFYVDHEDGALD
jgi:hypothetical protein